MVARYVLADACFNRPSRPCNLSVQRKIQGVSVKCFAQFLKVNQHWIIPFHHDYQLNYLEWGCTRLVEPPIMQGCGTIHINPVSLESCWLLQYSAKSKLRSRICSTNAREATVLSRIAICNASDDIQVFKEMFELLCTQFCHFWDFRARSVQFQVLVNIYSVQRPDFISRSHNGRVETYSSCDCVDQVSNPVGFTCLVWIFTIQRGMSERSFCIFRRIHLRLELASQVAYACFFFTPVH